ncbi:translation initiation factor eIF3 subunit [Nitzschia inconspicua]|uniref:Translation initiation factor eIF3 subunit n=1 Tax=Nitzschia inconspicua TaxID=303405 RepID=A0A9K3KH28_9STRA|nr:translation initiation factor eIF3 subunit [Nitzschia inconspicua]
MTDNWDDGSDDEWDVDDDALDARLGINKDTNDDDNNQFDDEVDLALKEKAAQDKANQETLKKKGSALAAKKLEEKNRKEELEIARKAMELEAEMESKLSVDERNALQRQRQEESELEMIDDAFGGGIPDGGVGTGPSQKQAGDKVVMKDMKDHMKHARRVAESMKDHGKIHFATIFIKELIEQSKDVLDDDAITDIIKTCNVIKNEKLQAAKRKVKGQPQKSKKQEKVEKLKAKQLQDEVFGDSNQYDVYDEIGEAYEDDFF